MTAEWTDFIPVLAPGVLQYVFVCRLCGMRAGWRGLIAYEAGLTALVAAGAFIGDVSIALQVMLLTTIAVVAAHTGFVVCLSASLLAIAVTWVSFGIVDAAVSLIPTQTVSPSSVMMAENIAGTCLNFAANMAAQHILSFRRRQEIPRAMLLIAPVLFVMLIAIAASRFVFSTVHTGPDIVSNNLHSALLVVQCAGLAAVLCTLAAYARILKASEDEERIRALGQARTAQRVRVREMKLRLEKTRALRHDWIHHLTAVQGLLCSAEYESAKQYLAELTHEISAAAVPASTGSAVVDAILADKCETAALSGVSLSTDPFRIPEDVFDDLDLSVIFSNALDNAILASASSPGTRSVTVSAGQQGSLLALYFRNTCAPGRLPPPGTGLSNIQSAARKYNGTCTLEKNGNEAVLSVLLCIP